MTDIVLRSLLAALLGLLLLLLGEARWRMVDRAREALRSGRFAWFIDAGGTFTWQ